MTSPRIAKSPTEYRLSIKPGYDEQKKMLLFVLETVQEFSSFQYELVIEERMSNDSLTFRIQGLRPQLVAMPGSGTAQFRKEYYGLKGIYSLDIIRQDGTKNRFKLQITDLKVEILRRVKKGKFVEVQVALPP
jgi:hypothetical protein